MKTSAGNPNPLGANVQGGGINFALFSKHAQKVILIIEGTSEIFTLELDPEKNKTKDIWHIFIEGLKNSFVYSYKLDGCKKSPNYFHPHKLLSDPYSKALISSNIWACRESRYEPKGYFFEPIPFDWENIQSPGLKLNDLIIYEMHVRGFSQHASSGVKYPGTFLGIVEKIPYLKDLGINAVELMPIQEFNECGYSRISKETGKKLCNYFGYSTVNYFSPMNRFATDFRNSINEFKMLVRELHRNGIEVILDIVFNHTAEKGEEELYSFMGIDHSSYYMLKNGHPLNYSGCGHTMNLNHPVLRQFVKDVLHYWVTEMGVDGFRFDLASIMNRDSDGNLMQVSPLIEDLTNDKILKDTKLIAEPWDIGAYQLGAFSPHKSRWSEWNGEYRDAIRSFIKGDSNSKNQFAARICGSRDIFSERKPSASINFITAHDGFTLRDLVSYNVKHNMSNCEQNKDGSNDNLSWNMGEEGPTDTIEIINHRNRQMKNFIVALFISRGVPMLLMGDEYGHTKEGNNNTWCQDNELNWFLWNEQSPFRVFVKNIIAFRKRHPVLQKDAFYLDDEIIWQGLNRGDPNWKEESPILAFTILNSNENHLYIAFNATGKSIHFQVPEMDTQKKWHWIVSTNNPPPYDFFPPGREPLLNTDEVVLEPFSSIILKLI